LSIPLILALFQSLIGRLKTFAGNCPKKMSTPFQSLIGRLKTRAIDVVAQNMAEFQSLIGRLKTIWKR